MRPCSLYPCTVCRLTHAGGGLPGGSGDGGRGGEVAGATPSKRVSDPPAVGKVARVRKSPESPESLKSRKSMESRKSPESRESRKSRESRESRSLIVRVARVGELGESRRVAQVPRTNVLCAIVGVVVGVRCNHHLLLIDHAVIVLCSEAVCQKVELA